MKRSLILIILISITLGSFAQWNTFDEEEQYCAHRTQFTNQSRTLEYLYDWQSPYMDDYDVSFYFLDITVTNTSTLIEGNTTIQATALFPLDTFAFELIPEMVISQIFVNGTEYTGFYHEGNNVLVPVDEIAAGNTVSAQIFYSGTPPTGSFFVGVDHAHNNNYNMDVTWSLSEPFAASDWFPVKQDLEDKADSCWVFLTTASDNMAGSQGLLTDVVDLGNGFTRYEWKSSYPIDYYLISFAVSDYQDYSIYAHPEAMGGDSMLVQNFIYNTPQCLEDKKESIDATPGMIELLSDLYILYPFSNEKYGHCLTELGGGMEHQTMTTLGGFWFGLVAHELGHMWFGDNVTCATWSDIWINEGFATYSDYLCRYNLVSETEGNSFMSSKQSSAMNQTGGSVYIPIDEIYPGNELRIFSGRLSYDKGAAIIHTLRHEIQDDDLFFDVMGTFQTEYGLSTATGEDFKNTAEEVTGLDFDQFFDQWYYGEGYPIYDLVWYSAGGEFHLSSTQTTSSSTPFFDMLLDIKLFFTDFTDTIITVHQTDNLNEFTVYTGKEVAVVQVDPNNWTMEQSNITVGVEETEKPVYFTLGPNPVTDYVTVYFLNPSNRIKEIVVTDISGKTILKTSSADKQVRLTTSDFDKGVYLVTVYDGTDILVKRFVK